MSLVCFFTPLGIDNSYPCLVILLFLLVFSDPSIAAGAWVEVKHSQWLWATWESAQRSAGQFSRMIRTWACSQTALTRFLLLLINGWPWTSYLTPRYPNLLMCNPPHQVLEKIKSLCIYKRVKQNLTCRNYIQTLAIIINRQDGRVEGGALIFFCENSKTVTNCWTTIDRRMLDPTKKKDTHVQGQRRSPNKTVGGAESLLESNPIPIRDAQSAQGTRGPTRDWARPAFECLSVSWIGTGQQWPGDRGSGCSRPGRNGMWTLP